MYWQIFAVAFFLAAGSVTASAAIGNDDAATVSRQGTVAAVDAAEREGRAASANEEAARFREAGEQACQQAVDAAALFGEKFRAMSDEMPRLMSQLSEQLVPTMQRFADEVTPTMREFADRLREIAKQAEQSASPDNR